MRVLAEHQIDWLQWIEISYEDQWFRNNRVRDGCMVPLLEFLARQTNLETLAMKCNCQSDAQIDQIREVVTTNAPGCDMHGDIFKDRLDEQEEPAVAAEQE